LKKSSYFLTEKGKDERLLIKGETRGKRTFPTKRTGGGKPLRGESGKEQENSNKRRVTDLA